MGIIILVISAIIPFIHETIGLDPCNPNLCGSNTRCSVVNYQPKCSCLPGHFGNPLSHCRRGECESNGDCGPSQACRNYNCVSACSEQCGVNAECKPRNHIAVCSCPPQYIGNPLAHCRRVDPEDLCNPSPCGINTKCELKNSVPGCTCLPGYKGSPLSGCRPECESDDDCSPSQTCQKNRCTPVCKPGLCASTALCKVQNHRAVCSCPKGLFGDPYVDCKKTECSDDTDCPFDRPSCLANKCMDINVCAGVCGVNAICETRGRTPICSCPRDMTGDPFIHCRPFEPSDLCEPNPCGSYAKCTPGHDKKGKERPVCTCPPGYLGNALVACKRGDCQEESDCTEDQNCINFECKSACMDQCGVDATCSARNHVATCSCPPGFTGNAIARCYAENEK